jgi:hypothetical protein
MMFKFSIMLKCLRLAANAIFIPEGFKRIARVFNAGPNAKPSSVPKGRLNHGRLLRFLSRPRETFRVFVTTRSRRRGTGLLSEVSLGLGLKQGKSACRRLVSDNQTP